MVNVSKASIQINNDTPVEHHRREKYPICPLTGDQPVYTLIVQLRNESKEKFNKIIPILGPFLTQVAFITTIVKRFEGSGLSDIFVTASITADKSVDQVMRRKHFRRIVGALNFHAKLCNQGSFEKVWMKE